MKNGDLARMDTKIVLDSNKFSLVGRKLTADIVIATSGPYNYLYTIKCDIEIEPSISSKNSINEKKYGQSELKLVMHNLPNIRVDEATIFDHKLIVSFTRKYSINRYG